jgi:hypothetical protein
MQPRFQHFRTKGIWFWLKENTDVMVISCFRI